VNTQKRSDLLSLHRALLSQWEKGVNELLVNYLSSGDLEKPVQLLALPTRLKRSYGKVLDQLPATRGDLVPLEERMKAIEDLLARVMQILEPKVEEPKGPTTATPAPRTRRYKAPNTAKP
jgi:hypothetical protein